MILELRNHSQSLPPSLPPWLGSRSATAAVILVALAIALVGLLPAVHGLAHSKSHSGSGVGAAAAAVEQVPTCGHSGHGCSAHKARQHAARSEHGSSSSPAEVPQDPQDDSSHSCGLCLQLALVKSSLALLGAPDVALLSESSTLLHAEARPLPVLARRAHVFRERGPPRVA